VTRSPLAALVLLALVPPPAMPAPAPGVAVVELFSSEGCSSCPPADRLLARLADEARASGRPIYTLEFHVDYWDHLGWRDPYDARVHRAPGPLRAGAGAWQPVHARDGGERP